MITIIVFHVMAVTPPPKTVDLAIIGSGSHALTLVTHLLQKRQRMRSKIAVFDPSGRWLSHWKQQFAALEIPHLRSPAVHHPDPNPFALPEPLSPQTLLPNQQFPMMTTSS
jgi:hypothetical protein